MKKLSMIFCLIIAVPFMLCSCFKEEVASVSLSKTELTLTVGDSAVIEASVLPENAENKGIEWTTSDSNIVTVSDGTVKAKAEGNAVVTAKAENGEKKSCNVTVKNKEINSITLSDSTVSVKAGKKIQLTAKVQPVDAPTDGLKWVSSDEEIAVVNSEGFVTGVKQGVVNIICKSDNGKEASCTVTVKADNSNKANNTKDSSNPSVQGTTVTNQKPQSSGAEEHKSDFIFYDSSVRKLTQSEISNLTDEQAQEAINEIYARNGYVFKDANLKAYFSSKSWYAPDPNFSTSDLNPIESYNVALLSQYR